MPLPEKTTPYTYADLLAWDEDVRAEIIDGEVYMMSSPSALHQLVICEMVRQLTNYLEGKKCRAFVAPFDVRLFEKKGDQPKDVTTVVQPDIMVVCDRNKIDERSCKGAPDMIIEVLSPSTRRHDRLVKLNLYQRAGVREYWIVDPSSHSVLVFLLDESGVFRLHEDYGPTDIAKVNVLDGCFIELCKVFPEEV